MDKNFSDITMIVDRSGSMQSCQQEAENGVNAFIKEQAELPGRAVLTLVQFDTAYEFLHTATAIKDVPHYRLVPRGMTALLDAVGRAINETGERLSAMSEEQRPGLVTFVIVTDGQENSSHEFTKQQINNMITHQQDAYSWQFTFLGANQDAFAEAASMGISAQSAMAYDTSKSAETFSVASANVSRQRHAAMSGDAVRSFYTDEERKRSKQ